MLVLDDEAVVDGENNNPILIQVADEVERNLAILEHQSDTLITAEAVLELWVLPNEKEPKSTLKKE